MPDDTDIEKNTSQDSKNDDKSEVVPNKEKNPENNTDSKEPSMKKSDTQVTGEDKDAAKSDDSNEILPDDSIIPPDEDKEALTQEKLKKRVKKLKGPEKGGKGKRYVSKSDDPADFWVPKTRLGKLVKDGEITTMKDAISTGLTVREPEIVDILLPDLDDEVLDVNMVQRMTDSGRRVRFSIMTVVGNGDGYVGLGSAKGKEVGPAIRKAIDNAKLNIISIRRGCGSWECGCGGSHTLPFTVDGKSGSTEVTFRPAPRGVGLAVGDVAKHILRLSGISDAWGFTRGQTRTTINYAKAVFFALRNTAKLKTTKDQIEGLQIISGPIEIQESLTEVTDKLED